MKPTIWYIHGASSTFRAFNWLRSQLPRHNCVDISYGDHEVGDVLPRLEEQILNSPGKINIIGHSLGGLIATALSLKTNKINKIFTISTPFGGSEVASYLRWISLDPLLTYIHPRSTLVRSVMSSKIQIPIKSIVTTSPRFPLSICFPKNDGVVTYDSQTALKGPIYHELNLNHFEVLLAKETADYAKGFLFR